MKFDVGVKHPLGKKLGIFKTAMARLEIIKTDLAGDSQNSNSWGQYNSYNWGLGQANIQVEAVKKYLFVIDTTLVKVLA